MGYNVLDIINKAIDIQNRRKIILKRVVSENKAKANIILMSKVLCNQIDEIIRYYHELEDEIRDTEFEEIDIIIYDKISFLINEFNIKIYHSDIENGKDYLKFSLNLAKDTYSLFIDIQGRLVKNINDTSTKTYDILSKIINNIKKQIRTIEKTIS
ncbi:hypothetical protein psyc5s11_23020 [Clostridium gelidum]|uniref:Uncharacterized protein n=2 Tax=Clostridium gelidum TaxID=704125 RepID=A0ABN6IZ03_9CLOT|nr:hypothetical protein psyc5s11_23020 [Clostridium gelidum]